MLYIMDSVLSIQASNSCPHYAVTTLHNSALGLSVGSACR